VASTSQPVPFLARTSSLVPGSSSLSLSLSLSTWIPSQSYKMQITIKESSMVVPTQDTPNHRLEVTNLDLFHAKYHVPLLFIYKPNGSSNFFEGKVLKEALSKVLESFYPVAGRLARDAKGRIEINCNGEGVLFVEAETDSAMGDFVGFKPRDELRQLIPTVDYSDISSYPLLVLQVSVSIRK